MRRRVDLDRGELDHPAAPLTAGVPIPRLLIADRQHGAGGTLAIDALPGLAVDGTRGDRRSGDLEAADLDARLIGLEELVEAARDLRARPADLNLRKRHSEGVECVRGIAKSHL